MFDRVIKINGVGPSTALAICSTFTPEAFSAAVYAQEIPSKQFLELDLKVQREF